MTTSIRNSCALCDRRICWQPRGIWWSQHREASLNWLALGLLLAAWNASDNDAGATARRRPEALRGYPYVSVRAHRSAVASADRLRSRIHESVNVL